MNVIEVQGTRSGDQAGPEKGREKFDDKTLTQTSQVPFYFGLSLGALMLYLKGTLQPFSAAQAAEEQSLKPDQSHHASQTDLIEAEINGICLPDPDMLFDTPHVPHIKHRPTIVLSEVSGINLHQSPYKFDSLDVQFKPLPQNEVLNSGARFNFPAIPTNDNHLGGGDGSSGGNGGGIKNPTTPTEITTPGGGGTSPPKANRAPKVTGPVMLADAFACTAVLIAITDLLKNATDPDGDHLSVRNVKVNGVLLDMVDGKYYYHGEEVGPLTINYIVTDGKLSVATTAIIDFHEKPAIVGTAGDDILLGTDCEDNMNGGDGNDRIDGYAGDDVIYGGDGDDHIVGGDGKDVVFGGDGDDIIFGGNGDDMLSGGNGNDRLFGGNGNDILQGGAGNNSLYGDIGDDVLIGGTGRNYFYDGFGKDRVDGGVGNDTVFASADANNDIYNGGGGTNKLDYSTSVSSITFDLSHRTVTGLDIGNDQAANFQVLQGGKGNDVFLATLMPIKMSVDPQVHTLPDCGTDDTTSVEPVTDVGTDGSDQPTDLTDTSQDATATDDSTAADNSSSTVTQTSSDGSATNNASDVTESINAAAEPNIDDDSDANSGVSGHVGTTYLGGAGHDTLDYGLATASITIDIARGLARGAEIGTDYFTSIESFKTGSGDDFFRGAGKALALHMTVKDAPDVPEGIDGNQSHTTQNDLLNPIDLSDNSGDLITGSAADQDFAGGEGFDTLDYSGAKYSITVNIASGTANGQDIGADVFSGIEHFIGGSGDDNFIVSGGIHVLDGRGGEDVFEFLAPPDSINTITTIAQICGFEVGDILRMSKYDIFDRSDAEGEDNFNAAYAMLHSGTADPSESGIPSQFRIQHEGTDQLHKTVLEADLDQNGSFETTIEIEGIHHLTISSSLLA
jgi:Ca2+-binding RTX toxin-like protein